ncbi:MAG: DsrE/DsrF/DrsH-like family protein, partial [Pseudomonadota bacterium]|nr:DsrE/DsrF/DrsH-like family protein [Pseudomonadota bacterium]
VSGSLDHALVAFEIAAGMQAMGMQITMWFALLGINSIRKSAGFPLVRRGVPKGELVGGAGRNTGTDTAWQQVLQAANRYHSKRLPLSRLNFLGAGPWLLRKIMRKKGMAELPGLIGSAAALGVRFRVCQTCVDTMACEVSEDLVVDVEVCGVSRYTLDVRDSHYNAVI